MAIFIVYMASYCHKLLKFAFIVWKHYKTYIIHVVSNSYIHKQLYLWIWNCFLLQNVRSDGMYTSSQCCGFRRCPPSCVLRFRRYTLTRSGAIQCNSKTTLQVYASQNIMRNIDNQNSLFWDHSPQSVTFKIVLVEFFQN